MPFHSGWRGLLFRTTCRSTVAGQGGKTVVTGIVPATWEADGVRITLQPDERGEHPIQLGYLELVGAKED